MYTVQIEFKIAETEKRDDQLDAISSLLAAWRMNGQVLGREFPIAQNKESYIVFVLIPDKNSLSLDYNNKYANQHLQKLENEFSLPKASVLGIDPESSTACECKTSNYYILFTTYLSLESPLKCGGCFGVIPLYKIPKTYDDDPCRESRTLSYGIIKQPSACNSEMLGLD
jgi:predicted  nucleic acid-binding Zn ribbon protein